MLLYKPYPNISSFFFVRIPFFSLLLDHKRDDASEAAHLLGQATS